MQCACLHTHCPEDTIYASVALKANLLFRFQYVIVDIGIYVWSNQTSLDGILASLFCCFTFIYDVFPGTEMHN